MIAFNDWDLRKLLTACGIIAALQIGLAILEQNGVRIPVIQAVNGFVFLTLVPGVLLMRILRIHSINIIESISYSVGLSLAFIMFSGAAINIALPFMKINQPLSTYPMLTTLTIEIAVLAVFTWLRDRNYVNNTVVRSNIALSLNSVLFLLFLLVLVIVGIKISDLTGNNIVLIVCLLAIASIIIYAAFKRTIQPGVFPVAVFIISLCLLYQTTLMSPYLAGTDIYVEYSYYQAVAKSGLWDYAIANPVNSCLSITVLGPYYSSLLGISGIWVFKAVYPLLFSLVPLIIYRFFRLQTGANRAFFATIFLMIVPTFSLEMISLCRQQVAEIFFAASILLLVENRLNSSQKLTMLIIYMIGVAVSHYSLGLITVAYFAALVLLVWIMRSRLFISSWDWITGREGGGLPQYLKEPRAGALPMKLLIIAFIAYFAFTLAWYGLVASGVNLSTIIAVWQYLVASVTQEFNSSVTNLSSVFPTIQIGDREILIRTALGLDFFNSSLQGQVFRIFQYLSQLFLILGCLRLLFRPKGMKFVIEFIALSVIGAVILAACIFVPALAGFINTSRWYHINLLILAVYCVLGAELIWYFIRYAGQKIKGRKITVGLEDSPGSRKFIALALLVPYFLFTSGLVYEISSQQITDRVESPYSIALSSYRLDLAGIMNERDNAGAKWLSKRSYPPTILSTDVHACRAFILNSYPGQLTIFQKDGIVPGDYVFLSTWNVQKSEVCFASVGRPGLREIVKIRDYSALAATLDNSNIIYSNSGPVIYSIAQRSGY
jgi:uncharacterized membrane protein